MSFSDDGIKTPCSSDFGNTPKAEYTPTMPWPGRMYKIHLRGSDKVITVTEGEVLLQSPSEARPGGGWFWMCVDKGNWLGFRNHVSGKFLGHDGKAGLRAEVTHHKAWEFFCVRHHPLGGYLLLVKYPCGEEMRQIGYASDGKTLVEKDKDGAQWAFEEV